MPELPEVEAVCRRLREQVVGARIVEARVVRCGTPAIERLAPGRRIESVERRGKHILMGLSGGLALDIHLRMSGDLFVIAGGGPSPASARIWLALAGRKRRAIILDDPRALAVANVLSVAQVEALDKGLGPEPLSGDFTRERFSDAARRSRQPAKLFLMNQRRVAGIGNIYAAEVLFRARIGPRRPIGRLRPSRLAALYSAIVSVLRDAVQSTFIAYSGPGEFRDAETFPLAVYGRERQPCLVCGAKIRRIVQGGRSTYFCPGCQR